MDSRERAEKIVNECSKRWIEESPDGFGCNLDLLSKEIEYHLIEAKREGMIEVAEHAEDHNGCIETECRRGNCGASISTWARARAGEIGAVPSPEGK